MTQLASTSTSLKSPRVPLAVGLITVGLAAIAALLPVIPSVPRGGAVGLLLFLAGIAELALWIKTKPSFASEAAVGSGLITAGAGLLFVINPYAELFPTVNIVMTWLLLRGTWVLVMALRTRSRTVAMRWVAMSGLVDLVLAVLLLAGLPVAAFIISIFGPTPELVASFSAVLAASFLMTGLSQLAVAYIGRRITR